MRLSWLEACGVVLKVVSLVLLTTAFGVGSRALLFHLGVLPIDWSAYFVS
jgi:hypothetical protein